MTMNNLYAVGVNCTATKMCSDLDNGCDIIGVSHCQISTTNYYNNQGISTCSKCESGYELYEGSIKVSGCNNTITFNDCKLSCTGCTNCGTGAWAAGNTGYEKRSVGTCNCNTCTYTTEYRCAAGYYGASTNGTSGCTRCPSSGGVYGTSAAGSTAITSCYIPANSSMTDSTGTYTFTTNCYYTN